MGGKPNRPHVKEDYSFVHNRAVSVGGGGRIQRVPATGGVRVASAVPENVAWLAGDPIV